MTDKEIIIDGVDVSRCEYRDWRNFCHCDNSKENEGEKRVTGRGGCKYNSDCYFKQHKRKEQECEAQRYKLNYYIEKTTQLLDDIDNYKQALDEIEEIANKQRKFDLTGKTPLIPVINEVGEDFIDILNIINKTEGGE